MSAPFPFEKNPLNLIFSTHNSRRRWGWGGFPIVPSPPPPANAGHLRLLTGSAVAVVMSPHGGRGTGGTWTRRGAFAGDSRGNWELLHPWEDQQPAWAPLPFSSCPRQGDIPAPGPSSFLRL